MRLIEADALLENVQFRLPNDNKNAEIIDGCVRITRRIIENAPTVDAEPVRHGKWIFDNHACGYYMSGSICSVCKGGALSNSAYCPHCGAKMDGGVKR